MPRLGVGSATSLLIAIDLALFSYTLWFRTHGIAESFWLYADQIRDWQIALRPLSDVPLVGPPSLAGGNTAGPIYYWYLWLVAHTLGPWFAYLPHAGGIGIAALQSVSDVALFHGFVQRLGSRVLALAVVLMVATAGSDATISATIWNPPVAAAIAKIGLATLMIVGADSVGALIAVSALFWLAFQAHITALPVSLAMLLITGAMGPPSRPKAASARSRRSSLGNAARAEADATGAIRRFAAILLVIAVLQVPWAIHRLTVGAAPGASPMAQSIGTVMRDPIGSLRPIESARALTRALHANFGIPLPRTVMTVILVLGLVALVARSRDRLVRAVAFGPLVCVIALFAVWQGPLNENYWYMGVAPSAALGMVAWIATVSGRQRALLSGAVLLSILLMQPAQAAYAWSSLRTPIYGALVRGSRAALKSGRAIREVKTSFAVPEGTDPAYIYSLLGGRLDGAAQVSAVIAESGEVAYVGQ